MPSLPRAALSAGLLATFAMTAQAQTPPTRPPEGLLEEITLTHSYALGRPGHFRFTPDGETLLFLRADADRAVSDLWKKDLDSGEETKLVDAEALLGEGEETLSAAEKARRERLRIKTRGFTHFALDAAGEQALLQLSGKVYLYDLVAGRTRPVALPEGVILDPRLSPDGRRLAFVLDHDLHLMKIPARKKQGEVVEGKLRALTEGGDARVGYGLAEFVAQEEMDRHQGYWWAPDGQRLIYQSTDARDLETFTIADAASPETPAQTFPYPRAGQANATVRLFVVGVDGKGTKEIRWDQGAYPYVARVTWAKGAPPAILVQARDQRKQAFLRVDPDTGETVKMLVESDAAWLNLSDSTPRWLGDGDSYLWATEASGGWALERHYPRADDGGLEKVEVLLDRQAGFRSLVHVDEAEGALWFLGGPDPVEAHLYRAPLSGGAPTRVSPEGGAHQARFAPRGGRYVLTRSTLSEPATSAVHGGPDPLEVGVRAQTPSRRPRIERVPPERAGGFHAVVVRPHETSGDGKYPVILYVYGGPHHNTVQADVSRYFLHQWMADHGFVVVCLDGRGTQWRGRDHERAIRERFHEVPLDDQVKGLTALGEHYPELDLDRVGVYGWSFGGYMAALAVLRRPDVFKVGVAGAPVVDWRYYDTHYTERYLGLPDASPDAYEQADLLTYARDLRRPLMLVHGIADDNVYFAHSLRLADALFRAGRPFELVPLVGLTHQVSDPEVREALYDRMVRFLGKALW